MRKRGSILVGLLWCLALLSVMVVGILHTARLDLLVVKNYDDRIQAHYLALAGIEQAKALLYQDALDRRRSAKNHTGELYDAPKHFRDIELGRGQFRVFRRGRQDEGGELIYGISDEESRLNVNYASVNELAKLPEMTPDVVPAIIDWKDGDNAVTPSGAEADYYSSLKPPYLPRNGLFQTTRELLMVRGISRELLLGDDVNQNGLLDPDAFDGTASAPARNRGGVPQAGWSEIITVDSTVKDVNAAGEDRVNIQTAGEGALTGVKGISSPIAKAIIASRSQNRLQSVADLLQVAAPNQPVAPGSAARSRPRSDSSASTPTGPTVISQQLLMDIADDLTVEPNQDLPGMVNINTASPAVLACLPGMTPELAHAIIAYRQSDGFFPNTACLLKVPGMSREIFKQLVPRVSARSETFRILSEGKVSSTGARQRIQVIVHIGLEGIDTFSYREDL
ncbi:MAG: comEA protein [Akkermansiaceae bacterium]|nr:comEA protein [Akkermansiaceae bacterium]